jgi:hypothetical protein
MLLFPEVNRTGSVISRSSVSTRDEGQPAPLRAWHRFVIALLRALSAVTA